MAAALMSGGTSTTAPLVHRIVDGETDRSVRSKLHTKKRSRSGTACQPSGISWFARFRAALAVAASTPVSPASRPSIPGVLARASQRAAAVAVGSDVVDPWQSSTVPPRSRMRTQCSTSASSTGAVVEAAPKSDRPVDPPQALANMQIAKRTRTPTTHRFPRRSRTRPACPRRRDTASSFVSSERRPDRGAVACAAAYSSSRMTRVSGMTPSWAIASAAAGVCIAAVKASRSATSAMIAT